MRRAVVVASGLALLGAASAISATWGRDATGDAAASLGGARVLVVDALFLRAEALRMDGRADEVPPIYRRILELDPGSDAAIDFLADVEAHDLLGLAPSPEARVRWWSEASDLVAQGLRKNPRSARLHWRAAELLLHVPEREPAVAARLEADRRDRKLEALRLLAEAARLSEDIPRLGFLHLDELTRLAPRLAAERLAALAPRAQVDECLALGREVLRLREDALSQFFFDDRPAGPLPAVLVLRGGLALVGNVRDFLEASPPRRADARGLLDAYVAAVGKDPVASALEPLLAR